MTSQAEFYLPKIEKQHAPHLEAGDSAIVLQRHQAYDKNPDSETAGQIFPEQGKAAFDRDKEFFRELLRQDETGEMMVLFLSSDTQYHGKGYRSMDTAEVAQQAAATALVEADIEPSERIININPHFKTDSFAYANTSIRPDKRLREPQIFDSPEYIAHLQEKYGATPDGQLTQEAWAAHESDEEKEVREALGAEGVHDIVERTHTSLRILEKYSRLFHASNPGKRLVIWATTHYDTISPLVKSVAGIDFKEYVGVDNGGGIVIELKKDSEPTFILKTQQTLKLGRKALTKE